MLSKKECKYRSKIIAENHLKKDGQKYIDQYMKDELLTYKKIYFDYELLHRILTKYNFRNLNNAIKNVGVSSMQAANAFQQFAIALKSVQ